MLLHLNNHLKSRWIETMKDALEQMFPPIIWRLLRKLKSFTKKRIIPNRYYSPESQDLQIYWDPEFAEKLENWGVDNVWNEIQMIMSSCNGKVLDIACGSGKTIELLEKFEKIDVYGFDISDLLIKKAIEKGIAKNKLKVSDATKTNFRDNEFDYSYSIGSIEHFTEDGIDQFISESHRYSKICSYHMVPVSRSSKNEGWLKTTQSFFNNSETWWQERFEKYFRYVVSIPSKWEDNISVGYWFVCYK